MVPKLLQGLNLKCQTQLPLRKVTHQFNLLSQGKGIFVSLICISPTIEEEMNGHCIWRASWVSSLHIHLGLSPLPFLPTHILMEPHPCELPPKILFMVFLSKTKDFDAHHFWCCSLCSVRCAPDPRASVCIPMAVLSSMADGIICTSIQSEVWFLNYHPHCHSIVPLGGHQENHQENNISEM